jgi:hypothetical protein
MGEAMNSLKIGTKAALMVALCTVLGFVVAGVWIYREAAALQEQAALERLRAEARAQAENISARFA